MSKRSAADYPPLVGSSTPTVKKPRPNPIELLDRAQTPRYSLQDFFDDVQNMRYLWEIVELASLPPSKNLQEIHQSVTASVMNLAPSVKSTARNCDRLVDENIKEKVNALLKEARRTHNDASLVIPQLVEEEGQAFEKDLIKAVKAKVRGGDSHSAPLAKIDVLVESAFRDITKKRFDQGLLVFMEGLVKAD